MFCGSIFSFVCPLYTLIIRQYLRVGGRYPPHRKRRCPWHNRDRTFDFGTATDVFDLLTHVTDRSDSHEAAILAARLCRTELLGMQGARVYSDIHVSGHLCQEGHYTMLDALQPENIIPAHQDLSGLSGYVDLASHQGYTLGEDLHITSNGNVIQIN